MSKTMSNPICWFEIYVQDIESAKKFYEAVFHIKLERVYTREIESYTFGTSSSDYGATGALVKTEEVLARGSSTVMYFATEDCSIEASRIVENGGKIHKEKTSLGQYGFIVLAYDIEGNMIGLHSMK